MPACGPRSRPSSYLVAALACAMLFGCAQLERAPEPAPPTPEPPTPAPAVPPPPAQPDPIPEAPQVARIQWAFN